MSRRDGAIENIQGTRRHQQEGRRPDTLKLRGLRPRRVRDERSNKNAGVGVRRRRIAGERGRTTGQEAEPGRAAQATGLRIPCDRPRRYAAKSASACRVLDTLRDRIAAKLNEARCRRLSRTSTSRTRTAVALSASDGRACGGAAAVALVAIVGLQQFVTDELGRRAARSRCRCRYGDHDSRRLPDAELEQYRCDYTASQLEFRVRSRRA